MWNWLKRVFDERSGMLVLGNGNEAAMSNIVIAEDGSKHEFLVGTVQYAKNKEPAGGHKPDTTIDYKR